MGIGRNLSLVFRLADGVAVMVMRADVMVSMLAGCLRRMASDMVMPMSPAAEQQIGRLQGDR